MENLRQLLTFIFFRIKVIMKYTKEEKMKKIILPAIMFLFVGLVVMFLFNNSNAVVIGTNYSDQVVVNNWKIIDSQGVEGSVDHPVLYLNRYALLFDWTLNAPDGVTLQNGDFFHLAIPRTTGSTVSFTTATGPWTSFYDSTNSLVIGEWRINNAHIEVVFNQEINNSHSTFGSFNTGLTFRAEHGSQADQVLDVRFGNTIKPITFRGNSTNIAIRRNPWHWAISTSNVVRWITDINPGNAIDLASPPRGQVYDLENNQSSYYINTFPDGVFVNDVSVSAAYKAPVSLESGLASSILRAWGLPNGTFKRIDSDATQFSSVEDFRKSLPPLSMGIFTDQAGIQSVVVSFGNVGNNGLLFQNLLPNFARNFTNSLINSATFLESERDALIAYFTEVYGSDNIINGHIPNFRVEVITTYPAVLIGCNQNNEGAIQTTTITNSADTIRNNQLIPSNNASHELSTMCGSGVNLTAHQARLQLTDEDLGHPLENVRFHLQRKHGDQWIKHTSFTPRYTNELGYFETDVLALGTYRFVQENQYSDDFDLSRSIGFYVPLNTVISDEFIISATDTEGHIIHVSNARKRFCVSYLPGDCGTFEEVIDCDVVVGTFIPEFNNSPSGDTTCSFDGWDEFTDEYGNIIFEATWTRNHEKTEEREIPNTLKTLSYIIYIISFSLVIFGITTLIVAYKKNKS